MKEENGSFSTHRVLTTEPMKTLPEISIKHDEISTFPDSLISPAKFTYKPCLKMFDPKLDPSRKTLTCLFSQTVFIIAFPVILLLVYTISYFVLIIMLAFGYGGQCNNYKSWVVAEFVVMTVNFTLIMIGICAGIKSYFSDHEVVPNNKDNTNTDAFNLIAFCSVLISMLIIAIWACLILKNAKSDCSEAWNYAVASQVIVLVILVLFLPCFAVLMICIYVLASAQLPFKYRQINGMDRDRDSGVLTD